MLEDFFAYVIHWLTNYIDIKAKLTCKGTCGRSLSVSDPEPHTSTPYTPWTCIQYSILIHTGKGGRVEPERRLDGQQFTKQGRKYKHDWIHLQSINSDKRLPQSPRKKIFKWRHFALMSIWLICPWCYRPPDSVESLPSFLKSISLFFPALAHMDPETRVLDADPRKKGIDSYYSYLFLLLAAGNRCGGDG